MIKKLAGAAVSTLLIASFLTGTVSVAGAVPPTAEEDAPQLISAPAGMSEAPADNTAASPDETASEDYAAYLFVHFVNNEKAADYEQIYFSVSENGTDWTTLNGKKPVLRSEVGQKGVRDPHIIRTKDGKFVIIATDLSMYNIKEDWNKAQTDGSQDIIIWKSDTIDGFTGGGTAKTIGTPDALTVWAPESIWDVDKEQYMVMWASLIGDTENNTCPNWKFRIYRSYTEDFETFTEPEVYMERESNIIDTTFYYDEASKMYYRFTKNEDNDKKWVFMEKGAHLDGDFEMVSTYRIDGKHYSQTTGVEGPTVYKDNTENKWYLLLDNWTYIPYETTDITKGVFTTAGEFKFNGKTRSEIHAMGASTATPQFRHGSVIPITKAELDALKEKYPDPEPGDPDKTTGELIYELGFDDGSPKAVTGDYAATVNGTITYTEGLHGGKAAVISGDGNFLSLDGSMLKGHKNLTFSFDVKMGNANANYWVFFAAPNDHSTGGPTYLGGLFKKDDGGLIACERFLNGRADDSYSYFGPDEWVNVTVVYNKTSTKVFVNGKIASEGRPVTETTFSLTDILGETPILYLGKATWGSGEYSNMTLDNFRVYDYAVPDDKVQEFYTADQA